MIKRSCLVDESASWRPKSLNGTSPEVLWNEWAYAENIKRLVVSRCRVQSSIDHLLVRTLIMSYLHDCCQNIFFATTPSYTEEEVTLCLPCDNALWNATSSAEWMTVLHESSPYGAPRERLMGVSIPDLLLHLNNPHPMPSPVAVPPFGLFVLIHAHLSRLFEYCAHNQKLRVYGPQETIQLPHEVENTIYVIQYTLHNWLQCCTHSLNVIPEETHPVPAAGEEPPFFDYCRPPNCFSMSLRAD